MPTTTKWLFIFFSVQTVVAVALLLAALFSPHWEEMFATMNDLSGGSPDDSAPSGSEGFTLSRMHFSVGVFERCENSGGPNSFTSQCSASSLFDRSSYAPHTELGNEVASKGLVINEAYFCGHTKGAMQARQVVTVIFTCLSVIILIAVFVLIILSIFDVFKYDNKYYRLTRAQAIKGEYYSHEQEYEFQEFKDENNSENSYYNQSVKKGSYSVLWIIAILSVTSLVSFLIATIVQSVTFTHWFFCGTDFCSYMYEYFNAYTASSQGSSREIGTDCVTYHGFGFVYAIAALFIMLFSVVISVALLWHYRPFSVDAHLYVEEIAGLLESYRQPTQKPTRSYNSEQGSPAAISGISPRMRITDRTTPSSSSKSTSSRHSPRSSPRGVRSASSQNAGLNNSRKEGADWPGDWEYQADTRLYWSDSQQLYLDPESQQYYDPHSKKWYDPKRDVWYDKD